MTIQTELQEQARILRETAETATTKVAEIEARLKELDTEQVTVYIGTTVTTSIGETGPVVNHYMGYDEEYLELGCVGESTDIGALTGCTFEGKPVTRFEPLKVEFHDRTAHDKDRFEIVINGKRVGFCATHRQVDVYAQTLAKLICPLWEGTLTKATQVVW